MTNRYSILINTCDKFEDCWDPFFKLWSIYWPDCNGKLFLNTEYKHYSYPGIHIKTVRGCETNHIPKTKRATWSQCLKWALESIDDNIILYMQDDYFLKDQVKNDLIEKYVELMRENDDIQCIHLTDQAVIAEKKPSIYEGLYPIKIKQRYRVSCQAALWRKEILVSYLRSYENAWQFEEFGSKRAAIYKHNFFVVDNSWVKINQFEIIPYIFTGIIQGKWYEEVVPLFEKHKIIIDFESRGFVKESPKRSVKKRLIQVWHRFTILLLHYQDIRNLKITLKRSL